MLSSVTKHLKTRLLLTVVAVLAVTQAVSAAWLWHESQEQVAILVQIQLSPAQVAAQVEHEHWESIWAFVLPAISCVWVSGVLLYVLIRRLTEPLEHLAHEVNQRSAHDLSVLAVDDQASVEIQTIIHSTNELLQRMAQGLEHERQFTADVAHELRTPLAGIRMHLELLAFERPETALPLLRRIDDLMQLTDQLLQLARASQQSRAGVLPLTVVDLVAEVCEPLQREYEWFDDIQITWSLPEQALCVASAPLLQIALKNLLDNARKYAGVQPLVTVQILAENRYWVLQVTDGGGGVAPEVLSQLTERFFRADQIQAGYGVGLSMVKRIAHLHHAQLQLANLPHAGLQVSLSLPKQEA